MPFKMEAFFKIAPEAAKRTYLGRREEAAKMLGKQDSEQQALGQHRSSAHRQQPPHLRLPQSCSHCTGS